MHGHRHTRRESGFDGGWGGGWGGHGSGFGPGGEGFVRFALIEDPPRVAEACQRIKKALAV